MEDYLLVEPAPLEQETETGIIMPGQQSDDEDSQSLRPVGTVIKVGPGHFDNGIFVEPNFRKGDVVYFRTSDYAGMAPMFAPCANGDLALLVRGRTVYARFRIDTTDPDRDY